MNCSGCARTNIAWFSLCAFSVVIWCMTASGAVSPQVAKDCSTSEIVTLEAAQQIKATTTDRGSSQAFMNWALVPPISAIVSAIAALIALLSARAAVYNDFQKMLIDWNKETIKLPFLGSVNDHTRMEIEKNNGKEYKEWLKAGGDVSLKHFAYMQLNTFEITYEYSQRWLNRLVRAVYGRDPAAEVWHRFLKYQVKKSKLFRDLINRDDLNEYYNAGFCELAKRLVREVEGGR